MWRFLPILLVLAGAPGQTAEPAGQDTRGGEDAAHYFLLARQFEKSGRVQEAIDALQHAMTLAPESAELRAELAGLYAREERLADAVAMAEEALERDAGNVEANRLLGAILAAYSERKQPMRPGEDPSTYAERAVRALEKGRGAPGSDLNTELTLGRLYLQTGRHAQAIAALRHVFEQQPQYSEGGMLLAAAQQEAGRLDDAIETLEATVEANPSFFRGYMRLIELYELRRRWKDAADAYASAQALNPRADLVAGRSVALMNSGNVEQAQALLRSAIQKQPSPNPSYEYLLAESQRRLKDYEGALATSRRLREAFPDRAVFVYQHAQLLEESGRAAEAERELRDLLSRDPRDANALNSLGYMFAERGERLDEAVELLQRALRIEPGNPSFLDSLGWAFFKQGRLDRADPPLTEAAEKSPENSVIQDHLGDLRMRQQRVRDAIAAWERALAGDGESIDRAVVENKLREARARLDRK